MRLFSLVDNGPFLFLIYNYVGNLKGQICEIITQVDYNSPYFTVPAIHSSPSFARRRLGNWPNWPNWPFYALMLRTKLY